PDPNLPAIEYTHPEPVRQPVKIQDITERSPDLPQENVSQTKTVAPVVEDKPVDEDFFDPRAETLLEHAKAFFKIGNRLQYHTYKNPIEICRTVMQEYPNTKYAVEAQILLRQVPERFRKQYNLTDEELGL
ncbi:MAG: hypothetical protein PHP01_03125, partial [Phycisphaerae bacterium]|nr:hypothetical protein [Phycisphaerae bacterium]